MTKAGFIYRSRRREIAWNSHVEYRFFVNISRPARSARFHLPRRDLEKVASVSRIRDLVDGNRGSREKLRIECGKDGRMKLRKTTDE